LADEQAKDFFVQTKLAGITEVAKRRPNEKFTALVHLINARGQGLPLVGLALRGQTPTQFEHYSDNSQ